MLRIDTRRTRRASSTWTTSALTATYAGRRPQRILHALTMVVTPMSLSSQQHQRKKPNAGRRWRDARSKRLGITVKVERDQTGTMNCRAKPTRRTGEPIAPARASVPKRFRRLKWNEVVWYGDFVADKRFGLQPWEGPGGFRADAFVGAVYRGKKTEKLRQTATRKTKQNTRHL